MTRNQLDNSVRNQGESVKGTTLMDTGREVSIIEDKGNADLTRTMGHKCRISDRENTDTYLHKQEEQSKFSDENAWSTMKISVKITQL